jgi:hypothetical protein
MLLLHIKEQKMRYLLILLLTILTASNTMGQRRIVVFNLETKVPIRNVKVWTSNGQNDSTNYKGECILPEKFDTLMLSKPGFLATRIPFAQVKDSIPLLSNYHRIGEVTVYGVDYSKKIQENINSWVVFDKTEYALQHPASGNILGLLVYLGEKAYNALFKKHKAPEGPSLSEDPILKAYQEAMEEKKAKQ